MNNYRLNRLFNKSGNCLDVAIDHGFFNELAFLEGIENIENAVQKIIQAKPDAIQLSVGQAEVLQNVQDGEKPALVLRVDVTNSYDADLPSELFSSMIDKPVEVALQLDAACVVVNLLMMPDEPDLYKQCISNIFKIKPACERYGMPLMIEPLVLQKNNQEGGYMVDGDLHKILPLVRQACELGADIIKADPCNDIQDYHRVVKVARKPVLPRGGGKEDEYEVFKRTYEIMRQGSRGIVYGRNIIQHDNPVLMTKALMGIVHQGLTPDQAIQILTSG